MLVVPTLSGSCKTPFVLTALRLNETTAVDDSKTCQIMHFCVCMQGLARQAISQTKPHHWIIFCSNVTISHYYSGKQYVYHLCCG